MIDTSNVAGPHKNHPVFEGGSSLDASDSAMIMLHGRGATAASILELAEDFNMEGIAYFAPQANSNTWYPNRFIAPVESNEHHLTSALQMVEILVKYLLENGITENKIFLLGFSQGACLALEYAARNPRNYAGIIGLSGGLIGPLDTQFNFDGIFTKETRVFLGCSDTDFHIPLERVNETADVFSKMGAKVKKEIYENMGHTINNDEIENIIKLLKRVADK